MSLGPGAPRSAVIALGAAAQIAQVLLLREFLMVFFGNELAVGVILASWMLWVGIGSRLGGKLSSRIERPERALLWSAAALLVVVPGTTLVVRLLRGIFEVVPGAYISFVDMTLSCVLLTAPVGLLLGAQFVLHARIRRERSAATDTSGASSAYVLEGVGSIIGGLLFTMVLVRLVGGLQASVLVAVLLLAGALLVQRRLPIPPRLVWPALLALTAGSLLLGPLDDWSYRAQWRMLTPEHELLETRQSPHGTISVLRQGDQIAFFRSGHFAFSAAAPESDGQELEEMDAAVLAHLSLAQHPSPARLLLVGGGLRGTVRAALTHPLEAIDYVEFDPILIETALRHLPDTTSLALSDPRVRVITRDGRLHVRTSTDRYDVVLVDVPDPSTAVLNRYYTREFFEEVRDLLLPGGILVIEAGTGGDMRGREVANRNAAIFHTLREIFDHVVPALVGGGALFFASMTDEGVSVDPMVLIARHRQRAVEDSIFSPAYFVTALAESDQRRLGWILFHHGRAPGSHSTGPELGPPFPPPLHEIDRGAGELEAPDPRFFINSDMRPVGYYHSLTAWDRLSRGRRPPAFDWMARADWSWIFVFAGLCLLPVVASRIRGPSRQASLWAARLAVLTTGLSTMAMQIALMFAFQSVYGFVYEMMGLIVALFMGGLVLGATLMRRWARHRASWRALSLVQGAIAIFALAMVFALPASIGITSSGLLFFVFALFTFLAGSASGLGFPVAVACYHQLVEDADEATGTIYGIELFGACIGALFAAIVIAPVLGLMACFVLSSTMNAAALLALVISGSLQRPT